LEIYEVILIIEQIPSDLSRKISQSKGKCERPYYSLKIESITEQTRTNFLYVYIKTVIKCLMFV